MAEQPAAPTSPEMATTGPGDVPGPVIDAHVHAFPPDVIADRDRLVARDHWFGALYRDPRAHLTTERELLASMDRNGIVQSVICGFPWSDPDLCAAHNDWMAAVSRASGGRLPWLGIVVPHHPTAAAEAERCFALGASGIGELNADAQGFSLSEPHALAALVAACLAAERPIMLHASEPVGHLYPGKGTATPDRLMTFIIEYPDLDLVLAHWGGGLPFYELMPEVAAACARVRYDTAASPYLYDDRVFRLLVDIVGPSKILWGSDFPVMRQGRFLKRTLALGLDAAEIFAANARATYRLPAVEPNAPRDKESLT